MLSVPWTFGITNRSGRMVVITRRTRRGSYGYSARPIGSRWAADPQLVLVDHDSYRHHRQVPVRAGGRRVSDPQGAVQELADLLRYRHGIVHASGHVLLHSFVVDRLTLFDPAGKISLT